MQYRHRSSKICRYRWQYNAFPTEHPALKYILAVVLFPVTELETSPRKTKPTNQQKLYSALHVLKFTHNFENVQLKTFFTMESHSWNGILMILL